MSPRHRSSLRLPEQKQARKWQLKQKAPAPVLSTGRLPLLLLRWTSTLWLGCQRQTF